MPVFASEQDVYAHIGRLLEEMQDDERLVHQCQRADTIVQYRYREPESQITLSLREGEKPRVIMGETDLEPEVLMTMEADTAHKFWLGKVNVTVALARGQMKAKGPVAKILKLVPLTKPVFPRYRQMLDEAGRKDLQEA